MHSRTTERLQPEELARAAELLRHGGTVAFATETVYGLGANALDPQAVTKIFAAKERPGWDPLIVHVSALEMLVQIAQPTPEAERLIARFWPGPLTLLLPRTSAVPDAVTAGRPLVGVRIPKHSLALELIARSDVPIAAPSANRFGRTSPTTAQHVLEDLDGRIDAVLDGGPAAVGVESTVFDPAAGVIYRPGAITAAMLAEVTGKSVQMYHPPALNSSPESLPSPGVGIRHYAPRARLVLVANEAELRQQVIALQNDGRKVGVMLPIDWSAPANAEIFPWASWNDADSLAQRVFTGLRALDAAGVAIIVAPIPAEDGIGAAIRDRLGKASRRS